MIESPTNVFIIKAQETHGNQYDYSLVDYVSASEKIRINCSVHGIFLQNPSEHLRGRGCQLCGWKRMDTAKFIAKALNVHGGRYDYSKANFVKSIEKTSVICMEHGEFLVSPNSHLSGSGCPLCWRETSQKPRIEAAALTFVERAKKIHGDKIDFSECNYVTAKTPTTFICPEHGAWTARPDNILHGKGCPGCRQNKIVVMNSKRSSNAAALFEERSHLIHNNLYDYSESIYVSIHVPLSIRCKTHGLFKQSPANHMAGNGCPDCSIFGYRISKSGWLYLQSISDEYIKIGITNHAPERRMKEHEKNSILDHRIIGKWFFEDGATPLKIETLIKRSFKCGVISREQMLDGFSETMYISELPKVLELIRNELGKLERDAIG